MISYFITAYVLFSLFISAFLIYNSWLRLRLVGQGRENVTAFRELAEYYKSKSYAHPVSTNIGEISEEAYERHVQRGEAYWIKGKIIIDTKPVLNRNTN